MIMLVLYCLVLSGFVVASIGSGRSFNKQRDSIPHRIHVNGVRGKSTVTRYTAAILRDAGLRTFGKTAGAAARVILPDGRDASISRRGQRSLKEQLTLIRSFAARRAEAIVMECAAVKPDYQDWLERRVMHSQIGIITNVRAIHKIELSLARSIPNDAILITAEQQPDNLDILRAECQRRRTRLVEAPIHLVDDADLLKFDHAARKENVAIGLAVAEIIGVPIAAALASMAVASSRASSIRTDVLQAVLPIYDPGQKLRSGLQKVLRGLDNASQAPVSGK